MHNIDFVLWIAEIAARLDWVLKILYFQKWNFSIVAELCRNRHSHIRKPFKPILLSLRSDWASIFVAPTIPTLRIAKIGCLSFVIKTSFVLNYMVPHPLRQKCLVCPVSRFVTCLATMASGAVAVRLRHGNFLNWHLSSSYLFLFLFFPLSLFLSFASLPLLPSVLPTISRYYIALSPLSGPVLRFRRYSSKSGPSHVL